MKINSNASLEGIKKIQRLDRYFFIGTTLLSVKFVLLAAAYLLPAEAYNIFSKYYYTASLLMLFAAFGFDFPFARLNFSSKRLALFILIHTLPAVGVLAIIDRMDYGFGSVISYFMYSFWGAIGGIVSFKLLFHGKYRRYFFIIVMQTFLLLVTLLVFRQAEGMLFVLMPVSAFLWGVITLLLYKEKETNEQISGKAFYRASASSFVINSAMSFGLLIDKYVASHYFALTTANAYIFAWGITAPLFYIGNFIERVLYSFSGNSEKKTYAKALGVQMVLLLLYFFIIEGLFTFFSGLLPGFVHQALFKKIFWNMFLIYSVFTLVHYTMNAYLFKQVSFAVQKSIAVYYVIWIAAVSIVVYFSFGVLTQSYLLLLSFVGIYSYGLLGIKAFVLLRINREEARNTAEVLL